MSSHVERSVRVEQRHHFRRKPRAGRRILVRYAVLDGDAGDSRGGIEQATTLNIGVGGAFIQTEDPPPPGTLLRLTLEVPPGGRTIEIRGDVRWIADADDDEAHGMGVRFAGLDDEHLRVLNDYFASLTSTVDHDDGV